MVQVTCDGGLGWAGSSDGTKYKPLRCALEADPLSIKWLNGMMSYVFKVPKKVVIYIDVD